MKYRIDWIQFTAALVLLISYSVVILACFLYRVAWPVILPCLIVCIYAAAVWMWRDGKHRDGGAA